MGAPRTARAGTTTPTYPHIHPPTHPPTLCAVQEALRQGVLSAEEVETVGTQEIGEWHPIPPATAAPDADATMPAPDAAEAVGRLAEAAAAAADEAAVVPARKVKPLMEVKPSGAYSLGSSPSAGGGRGNGSGPTRLPPLVLALVLLAAPLLTCMAEKEEPKTGRSESEPLVRRAERGG